MAPEQLEGKEVDGRADIFAFGAVLYEMVTGKKAFAGESQASVIAAILEREPPRLTEIEPVTPPALEHLVSGCLSKDRDARWQSAGDVERQLRWIAEGGSTEAAPAALREKGRSGLVLAALVTIAAVSFGLWALLRPAAPPTTTRLSIALPPGQELAGYHPLAISRDGSRIVYAARDAEGTRLYLRSVDEFEPRLLDGTEGADQPFFSPDGEWVAFFAPGKIQRISVEGGNPILIAEAAGGGEAPGGRMTRLFSYPRTAPDFCGCRSAEARRKH